MPHASEIGGQLPYAELVDPVRVQIGGDSAPKSKSIFIKLFSAICLLLPKSITKKTRPSCSLYLCGIMSLTPSAPPRGPACESVQAESIRFLSAKGLAAGGAASPFVL